MHVQNNKMTIMKKLFFFSITLSMLLAFASCSKSPQYIYVDNMGDEAKVSFVDAPDDNAAYSKAFENYSNARFYPLFSEFEKTRKYIAENDSADEACEGIEGGDIAMEETEGGDIISTDDDVNSLENMGDSPSYEELSKFNTPSFTLYKITGSDAKSAAQDLIDGKITYDEFQKKIQDNVEVINLYDKNFDACVSIDRKVFDKLQTKLKASMEKIDKDAANKTGDAVE